MYKLFISNEEVDLNTETKIMLSRKIFDLTDISKRGVQFTNAFTVQPTAKNLRLLGYPNALPSNNTSFETSQPYALLDQNTLVSSGRVIVKDFDQKKGIKIQLSEGVDFWEKVGALNLRDLSLHGDDFLFNTTNMDALKVLGSSIFLTALHDARGDKTNTALTNYNYTRPFYRFRIILDRIAEQVGYSVDYGDILTTTEMNLVGCASNADRFWFSDFKIRFEDVAVNGTLGVGSPSSTSFDLGNITEAANVLTNTTYKSSWVLKGRVNAPEGAIIRFIFSDRTERFTVPQGISDINFLTDESDIGTTLEIETNVPITFEDVYLYTGVSESEIFDVDAAVSAVIGFYALADYNLPNMTCKDFIKMLMKLFFLNPATDNDAKVITFTRFSDDLNTNNFTDLSGRVQRNNAWSTGDIYGKNNFLGYKNDQDIDEDLGRAIVRVDNVNANDERDLVLISEFSASKEVDVSGERVVTYPIYSTDAKRESTAQRIVYFNEVGAFGFNATFAEISFQRLAAQYYFGFIENTTRERSITLEVLLKFHEFMSIQRRPLIFNPDLGGLFLVTEIDKYTNEGRTVLNCIKYG